MIYGQLARNYGGNNYKVVSEGDAILEYMFSEAKQYQNLMLTESFFDDEDKLVMEAKYQVLQEAISGAIIAAIIAVLGAIAGLIVLIIKLVKKGKEKLKEKAKAGVTADLTDEQKKELTEKIKAHVDSVKWTNVDKSKLMNFCTFDFIGSSSTIMMMKNAVRSMISQISPLSNISSSSSADNLKSIVNSFYDDIKKINDLFVSKNVTKDSFRDDNLCFKSSLETGVSGGPVAARAEVNKFMQSNYFDRSTKEQEGMKGDIDKIEKFLNENQEKIKTATDTKDKDSDYTDASSKLNEGLKLMKDMLDTYRAAIKQWYQIELFRLKYCQIVMEYNGKSSDNKDENKEDKNNKEDK